MTSTDRGRWRFGVNCQQLRYISTIALSKEPVTVVAFMTSLVVAIIMSAGILWYAKRRPVGTSLTWGEAMAAAVYVFFLAFLAYGVVPHQWLTLAENEWSMRADRILLSPAQQSWMPFDITARTVSDTVATVIYGIFIGVQIYLWAKWQNRGSDSTKRTSALTQASSFGRPLIKQG